MPILKNIFSAPVCLLSNPGDSHLMAIAFGLMNKECQNPDAWIRANWRFVGENNGYYAVTTSTM